MSRIQQLVQPGRRTTGGKVAFPLLGLAAACIALYAQAEVTTPHSVNIPAPVTTAIPTPAVKRGPVLQPQAVVAGAGMLTECGVGTSACAYSAIHAAARPRSGKATLPPVVRRPGWTSCWMRDMSWPPWAACARWGKA